MDGVWIGSQAAWNQSYHPEVENIDCVTIRYSFPDYFLLSQMDRANFLRGLCSNCNESSLSVSLLMGSCLI